MINLFILAGFGICAVILYAAVNKLIRVSVKSTIYDEDDEICVLMDDPDYIQLLNGRLDLRACRVTSAPGKEIVTSIENIPFDLAILSEENYEYINGMKCLFGKCEVRPACHRTWDDEDESRNIRILYSERLSGLVRQLVSKGIIREAQFIA